MIPRPVMVRSYWPGVGRLIDVRVNINGQWCYTTRIRKDGQTTLQVVKETRRQFRSAQWTADSCKAS